MSYDRAMLKIHLFHVTGTHCPSCKILIEDILQEQNLIDQVTVDLKNETIAVVTKNEQDTNELMQSLGALIKPNGYSLSLEKLAVENKNNDIIWQALPIGLAFLVLFFLLQKSGVLNFGIGGTATPTTSFVIGLVASVSSCLAIVGGLILSISAKISQDNISDKKTIVLFHFGRLAGFAILGGLLGLLGEIIGINFTVSAILGLLASLVMILLGLNLVGILSKNKVTLPAGIFKFFRRIEHQMILLGLNLVGILSKNKVTLPAGIFKFFRRIEHQTFAPLLVGLGTFFLPCGFTQSMQIAALSSGSFITGSLIMFSFALGTFPVLAMLSFGSASLAHSKFAPLFFKTAGVVVIGLGTFALLGGLTGLGIIRPLFNI